MKKMIVSALFLVSFNVRALDYSACEPDAKVCENSPTCSAFYGCLEREYHILNILILKAINETDLDQKYLCVEKRNNVEFSIEAHATTIECVDSDDGPRFGG